MRKLVSIQKIKDIRPIEGADRIEIAQVLGWQCVVSKDKFKVGDLCAYFEIDSFLPVRPEYEFLRNSSFKKNPILGEGFKLKTMKFKGQISQGLVMPLSEVHICLKETGTNPAILDNYFYIDEEDHAHPLETIVGSGNVAGGIEGADLTELCGVREWEIPERASTGGTIKGTLPGAVHKTDETRIQSEPELLNEFKGHPYYITTKYDGTSCSVMLDKKTGFHVMGHNYEYKDDDSSSFYRFVKRIGLEENMRKYMNAHPDISCLTIQGEYCGEGIQKNRLKLSSPDWFVFTVDINYMRVGWEKICEVAKACNLKTVDCQETGSDLTILYPTVEALIKRSEESPKYTNAYGNGQPEGIVIRPLEPAYSKILQGSLSMKVINNKYLLKNED